jgi:hypothetical protein
MNIKAKESMTNEINSNLLWSMKKVIFLNMKFKRISWKNVLKAVIIFDLFFNQDVNEFTEWNQI